MTGRNPYAVLPRPVLIRKFAFLQLNIRPVSGLGTFIEKQIKNDNDYDPLPRNCLRP